MVVGVDVAVAATVAVAAAVTVAAVAVFKIVSFHPQCVRVRASLVDNSFLVRDCAKTR